MQYAPGEISTLLLQHLRDGSCKTLDELDAALPLTRRQISHGAATLIRRDYLDRVELGCYCLTPAGVAASERGELITSGPIGGPLTCKARRRFRITLRQRAWNVMRMSVTFTIGELALTAARDDKHPEINLRDYLRFLTRTGYVVALPIVRPNGERRNNRSGRRFRLLKDTGPIAPEWQKSKSALWDHNLGELIAEVSCDR